MSSYLIEDVEEFVLENGLRVLIKKNSQAPVFTCQLWFKVGAIDEPLGMSGSAHLIEHMLFRSSKNFKGGEISQTLRGFGGIDNAATSYDYTYYWVLLGPKYLEFAIKIMAERFYPLFDREELKKEIGVVLSELEGYENRPTAALQHALTETAFERSPYKRPIIGYREDLEHIERDELVDFYKKYYIPNNATLILCGDIDKDQAIKYINKYFGPVSKGEEPKRKYPTEPVQKSFKTVEVDTEGDTILSFFAFHIPNIHHKDSDALSMLGPILTDGKNSRLYKALVSTGKAVSVYASALSRKLDSFFVIDVAVNPSYSKECISSEIIDELEKIKREPITQEELEICLNQTKADIIYETDSVSGLGNALGIAEVYGNWRDYNDQIPRLEKVTPEDISYVLNKYFRDNNCTLAETYRVDKLDFVEVPKGLPKEYDYVPDTLVQKNTVSVISDKDNNNIKRSIPKRYVLDNGIRLLVMENHSSSTVAVEGFVRHGDMYEPIDQPGVSDLCAKMLSRGTKTRNYLEIAKSLDSVGAYVDFDVTCEKLSFSGKALSEYADLLLYNISDCLINSVFPENSFEKAKDLFVSELTFNIQTPAKVASSAFYSAVLEKGQPYYLAPIYDTIDYVKSAEINQVKDFYKGLRPEDTVISVAGDVDADEIFDLCQKYFSDFEKGKIIVPIKESIYDLPGDRKTEDIPFDNASEAAVVYGYPINMKREAVDFYKFRVANQILGGGGSLNSRLGVEIRENRGLVYGISSGFSGGKYNGVWQVSFGTNRKYVDETLEQTEKLMREFVEFGVNEKELTDTKNFILGMFAKGLETNEGIAACVSQIEDHNLGLDYMYAIGDKYKDISVNDIKEVSEKYIYPEKGLAVIVG